jgi:protein-S-isoprenylcysteine O-methyltransferase Ste14
MPSYIYIVLALGWFVWFTPFFWRKRSSGIAQQVNPRARWGIVLELIAFSLLWQSRFWEQAPHFGRLVFAALLFIAACWLSWTAVSVLGRQWRLDAGLNKDHELVRSGPYAIVRHPIYTSMLCMLVGTGLLITPWPLFLAALLVFIIGTEIRVRSEEELLASRFGTEFSRYRRSVPAYVPWLRF